MQAERVDRATLADVAEVAGKPGSGVWRHQRQSDPQMVPLIAGVEEEDVVLGKRVEDVAGRVATKPYSYNLRGSLQFVRRSEQGKEVEQDRDRDDEAGVG